MKLLHNSNSGTRVLGALNKNPLNSTPFGQAFIRYDGADIDKDFAASYAAFSMGTSGFRNYLVKALYGDFPIKQGAFSMDSSEANYERLFEAEGASTVGAARVRRKGKKFVVSIPLGKFDFGNFFYPSTHWAAGPPLPRNAATVTDLVTRIRASKFRNLFTVDKKIDVTLGAEDVLAVTPASDYEARTRGRGQNDYPTKFRNVFTKFRFLRASLEDLVSTEQKRQGIGATYGTRINFADLSVDHPAFVANTNVACDALALMLGEPIFGFVEAELDADFIQQLTGQDIDEVPLSLVGNWLNGTIEFQLFSPDDTIGDSAKVSSLSRSKSESEATKVLDYDPASNSVDRLCIDDEGFYYYLPKTDIVEDYEAEIEVTFTDEKGEWATTDVTNPHNVIRFVDAQGVARRLPRKIQADRLVYTDFKAGILSYTDASGLLKTEDVGTFRNVTASHIREFLRLPLTEETYDNSDFLSMLDAAVRSAAAFSPNSPMPHVAGATFLNEVQAEVFNRRYTEFLTGGSSHEIIMFASVLKLSYRGIAGLDQDFLDELEDLQFRHFSPTSPIPEFKAIYLLLAAYTQNLIANFETVASNYRLLPTLKRIGTLSVLVKNSAKFPEIEAQDAIDREAYLNPAEDYRTVEIPEIPFTRGVKLLPHQVKVFASLKRFPKRFTLDISAGGGKTFTAVLVALMYMKGAGVKRPIVICPEILLKNYFQDATYATSGAVNIIAVSSDILRRWGPERLGELIAKAPINTVVVASFGSMAKGTERIYATRRISVNTVTEFLKQFNFDMAVVDESHRIKSSLSNTNNNVARVMARAKYSGIMTGTLIFNGAKDVVGQFNLMDPTIFGSNGYFDAKYMEKEHGVSRAKGGAPREVRDRIASQTAYVQITRKEWAALLPPKVDEFDGTNSERFWVLNDPQNNPDLPQMTQAQTDYYNLMLRNIREEILKDAESDKSLARLLRSMDGRGEDAAANDDDEQLLETVMNRINPYLARLEIFIANPTNSREADFTSKLTNPEDKTSPKAKMVARLCRQHIERGYIGKILVFTQYNESAEGIFNALPPELKSLAVHYSAEDKNTLIQFEEDDAKLIMVGNEQSIGTGLNLQMASRIIRCESTWNWGALEQAESRVNRPVPKSEEKRKGIYLDWIIVNQTIDITKIGRMISKAVESYKFIYAGNPAFDKLEPLEPVKMSLENVLMRNNFNDDEGSLMSHFDSLAYCRVQEELEFEAFRNDPNTRSEPYPLNGGVLPGSGLLKNVPYVPGMALHGVDELGLVPFITFVTKTQHSTLVQFDPLDYIIHTEAGDGRCLGVNRNRKNGEISSLRVELPDGTSASFDIAAVFVVTKPSINLETRREIAQAVMTEHIGRPVVIPPEAPVRSLPTPEAIDDTDEEQDEEDVGVPNRGSIKLLRNKPVPNADKKANNEFMLYGMSVGHMYALTVSMEDPDVPKDLLVDSGFRLIRPYFYAEFKRPDMLETWYNKASKVIGFAKDSAEQIEEMIQLMKEYKPGNFFQNVSPLVLRDFWRSQTRVSKAGTIAPFISVEDNGVGRHPKIYLVALKHINPQFRIATSKVKVPGVVWDASESDQYWFLAPRQKDVITKLKEVNAQSPVKNFVNLQQKLKTLRPTPAK